MCNGSEIRFEIERETLRRWQSGYVTERERRILKEIRSRQMEGVLITPAQLDFAVNIESALQLASVVG